jgi:uncharacterized protein YidB (DUF937 family)
MGLLDSIAGQVLGGGKSPDTLINAVMGVLGSQETGGLAGIVKQFAGAGLGEVVNSWVSTGANLPVTPAQIKQGLGSNAISQIAQQAGISHDDVAAQLSKLLPQVVDKLTPNGAIPQGDLMSQGMSLLKGLMK